MKLIAVMVLSLFAVLALAHEENGHAGAMGYDCAHPPADAAKELPGLLGRLGRLACLPGGNGILANGGWSWRYPASFVQLPMIPAFAHADSVGKTPPFYFTEIAARALTEQEAAVKSRELQDQVEPYRPEGTLASMAEVEATNNYGSTIRIYMPMQSEKSGWLIVCDPECRSDYVILVQKLQRN